jgi:hypothetical protein
MAVDFSTVEFQKDSSHKGTSDLCDGFGCKNEGNVNFDCGRSVRFSGTES